MPPKKDNRSSFVLRIPNDWRLAIEARAAEEGVNRMTYIRRLISDSLTRLRVEHTPDDYGVFELKCRRKSDRLKQARRKYVATYRARRKARLQAKQEAAAKKLADSIQWTFHPTGQITTSDLDPLATYVGIVNDQGHFLPESTRYGKDRVLSELRKLAELGPLPGDRFALFLNLNTA